MLKTLPLAALLSGALLFSGAHAAESPLMRYDGQQYQGDSLPMAVRKALHELALQYNSQRRQVFDEYALNRYLQEEAERQGKELQTLQQELFAVSEPTEAELKAFYQANRARISGGFEQLRPQLTQYLSNQQLAKKQQQVLAKIAADKNYSVELAEPEPLRFTLNTDGYPSKGNPDAPITLVEFADYQCPHCKNAASVVDRLLERYGDQLRVVYRDFPINRSGISRNVAEAAVCADQQGQFWPFHDLAFERQNYLKSIPVDALAKEAGLDMAQFSSCYEDGAARRQVDVSLSEARELGLTSTPSFFVNGRLLGHSHGDLEQDLVELIDKVLKAGG